MKRFTTFLFVCMFAFSWIHAQREHLMMDFGWKFSYGHSKSFEKDFYHGTSYFTYFAKTGNGDGPASGDFDDRSWRIVDLPHDWAVEQDFSGEASHSHGYKTVGWKYPEKSLGWYRKNFFIPTSDLGRKIFIQFDGIFRNSDVWINGFYVGHENSGYAGFEYDITDYLNYNGNNVVAVRVDASVEEGWFYEGAGIYRHVWLNKTAPVHIKYDGVFASSEIIGNNAVITARIQLINDGKELSTFSIENSLWDTDGKLVAKSEIQKLSLKSEMQQEFFNNIKLENPKLWSPDAPNLYTLKTNILADGKIIDQLETTIGVRSLKFDAKEGFFLNGKPLKIVGSNNHQNHAGVGSAIPDDLQYYRIKRLKEMGSNAYRCSHYPPTQEMLEACDKLGMMVLVENRLMGINKEHFDLLERMIKRHRNHPSVIAWSIGNEEWAIESNIKGARITETMQRFAKTIDSTRMFTVAVSGGCGNGSSQTIELMGFNYLAQCDIDEYHKKFPNQPSWGTEETSGCGTRGIYYDDFGNGHMAQFDRVGGVSIERGWKFYDERPWLAGLFYWTGFDYKGEPNPMSWPAVSSQFGIIDACGFPKDSYFYLKSWWGKEPVLHLLPHWNWIGKEGEEIPVWAYSNCEEVELFLNNESLGKQSMPKNGHLEWKVIYKPGVLLAKGFKNGKEILKEQIETSGEAAKIAYTSSKTNLKANGEDLSVIDLSLTDNKGIFVPDASSELEFTISGPGKIIGVGNGDPSSHEPDKFFETVSTAKIHLTEELVLNKLSDWPALASGTWRQAFQSIGNDWKVYTDSLLAIKGSFELSEINTAATFNLFSKSILEGQSIYINGKLIGSNIVRNDPNQSFKLDASILKTGKNEIVFVGQRFRKKHQWDNPNTDPGTIQLVIPANQWKRKVFNGHAQVIVQALKQAGEINLQIKSAKLETNTITLKVEAGKERPCVP